MATSDNRGLEHRRMLQKHLLHFAGIDVAPSADDEVLRAILEREITVRIETAHVAGMQPTVGKRGGACFRVLPIPLHHRGAADEHFADRTRRQRNIVRTCDANLHAGLRRADRPEPCIVAAHHGIGQHCARHGRDRHGRFTLAVDLREPRTQRLERGLAVLDVHGTPAKDDAFEVIEPRARDGWMLDQPLDHGRSGEKARALPTSEQLDDLIRIEAARLRNDVDRGARNMRHDVQPRAVR